MENWEQRLQALWQLIQLRFTTSEPVFLGVCSFLQSSFGIPCAVSRIALLVLVWQFTAWTVIGYLVAAFFVQQDGDAP